MADATVAPMAPPTLETMLSMAITTATYWWEVAAMTAICSQITKGAAAERDEDLAHDDVADVDVRLAEQDHEPDAEDGDRDAKVEGDPLEAAGPAHGEADEDGEEARSNAVDVGDVARVGDGNTVHDLQEREEVAVPDVEGHEERGGQDARADDRPISEQVVRDEGDRSEVLLPGRRKR